MAISLIDLNGGPIISTWPIIIFYIYYTIIYHTGNGGFAGHGSITVPRKIAVSLP